MKKDLGLLFHQNEFIWQTGKVLVFYSGYCVLQEMIKVTKEGIYAVTAIKNQCYWSCCIPVAAIKEHFKSLTVGFVDALQGKLDGVSFQGVTMKESDFVTKMTTIYDIGQQVDNKKTNKYTVSSNKQQEVFK